MYTHTMLHILYTVGDLITTCFETDVVFCVFDTVFQTVQKKNKTKGKTSQIVTQPAHCIGRTDVRGVDCFNWIIVPQLAVKI